MNKHILFIQGGGDGGYKADTELVGSLQKALGKGYDINYPEIKSDESASDFGWIHQIDKKISEAKSDIILVGHSFGASMILKYLSENSVAKKIAGIFLLATPFWNGNEDWQMKKYFFRTRKKKTGKLKPELISKHKSAESAL